MLPKKEKIIKSKAKQLELDAKAAKTDDPKKQSHNRLFVTLTLGLTILLCLAFFLYRQVKLILDSHHTLLPTVSLTLPALPGVKLATPVIDIDQEIDPLIAGSTGIWSIYAQIRPSGQLPFMWSRNFDSLAASNLFDNLSTLTPSLTTSIAASLPEGLPITEKIDTTNGLEAAFLIHLPQKLIFIAVKNPDKQIQADRYLPSIVSTLYWNLLRQH